MKDTRVLGPPQRAQKNSPAKPQVFQGTFKIWGKLTHLKPLTFEEVNGLLHSLLKLLLF